MGRKNQIKQNIFPAPSGPQNSRAFNFLISKALLKALHCGVKVVKSLLNAPAPGGLKIMNNDKWPKSFEYAFHLFPYPMVVQHEIWLHMAQWFQRIYEYSV